MFENLSERLESAFKQLKGEGRINEINIATTVKDIRRALVDADVNYKIAKEFTDTVKEKALGEKTGARNKSRARRGRAEVAAPRTRSGRSERNPAGIFAAGNSADSGLSDCRRVAARENRWRRLLRRSAV